MRKNPFTFGRAVTGNDFVDREEELKTVMEAMLSGQSLLLYSPRRLGKTSLLLEAKRRLERKLDVCYVDLFSVTSRQRLAEEIVASVAKTSFRANLSKIAKILTELLSSLRPRAVFTSDGEIGIDLVLSEGGWEKEMIEALDFGEKLAKKRKVSLVVIFDEFQEISNLDGLDLEKLMRSRFQLHKHVSYVFCGSKQHILTEMFSDQSRALYKFSKPLSLGPLDSAIVEEFIVGRFAGGGGTISKESAQKIAEISGGNPYNLQRICYEIWSLSRKAVDLDVVDVALGQIVEHSSPEFEQIWEQAKGSNQRRLLKALAQVGEVSFGHSFIREFNLKSPGHVR
ncbi:MAG: ATP-binding protein, partial [Thermoplasmata archaeon]